jgi:hypothetical protein
VGEATERWRRAWCLRQQQQQQLGVGKGGDACASQEHSSPALPSEATLLPPLLGGLVGPIPSSVEALACRLLDNGGACALSGNAFRSADCAESPCADSECSPCKARR